MKFGPWCDPKDVPKNGQQTKPRIKKLPTFGRELGGPSE